MKNKIILILCFFLTGCGNYHELNNMAIVTAVSIDKKEDNYELGFLIANSQKAQTSTQEGEAQTTVYSGFGKNLTEASENIDYKSPKKLYYGHINVVVISEEVAKNGFLKIADYLLRYPESRKKFLIVQTKDNPKEILKVVSPLESFPSQSIATLLKANKDSEGIIDVVDYSSFIGKILDPGFDPVLPVLAIEGDKKSSDKISNIESTEPEAYITLDSVAIYRKDLFLGYEDFLTGQAINIINNNIEKMKFSFKHDGSSVGVYCNFINTKVKVINPKKVKISVDGQSFISEINNTSDLKNPNTINNIEKSLNKSIESILVKTITKMQEKYHSDVFGFGNKIYQDLPNKWEDIKHKWNEKHFAKIDVDINVNIKINSSGSLDKTIKEVLS